MNITIADVLVWMIVGMLAGSLTGMIVKRKKEGFGKFLNLGVGLAGALIGGFLFDLLRIDFGLADIAISLKDIVAAFVGALIFLAALSYGRSRYRKNKRVNKLS